MATSTTTARTWVNFGYRGWPAQTIFSLRLQNGRNGPPANGQTELFMQKGSDTNSRAPITDPTDPNNVLKADVDADGKWVSPAMDFSTFVTQGYDTLVIRLEGRDAITRTLKTDKEKLGEEKKPLESSSVKKPPLQDVDLTVAISPSPKDNLWNVVGKVTRNNLPYQGGVQVGDGVLTTNEKGVFSASHDPDENGPELVITVVEEPLASIMAEGLVGRICHDEKHKTGGETVCPKTWWIEYNNSISFIAFLMLIFWTMHFGYDLFAPSPVSRLDPMEAQARMEAGDFSFAAEPQPGVLTSILHLVLFICFDHQGGLALKLFFLFVDWLLYLLVLLPMCYADEVQEIVAWVRERREAKHQHDSHIRKARTYVVSVRETADIGMPAVRMTINGKEVSHAADLEHPDANHSTTHQEHHEHDHPAEHASNLPTWATGLWERYNTHVIFEVVEQVVGMVFKKWVGIH